MSAHPTPTGPTARPRRSAGRLVRPAAVLLAVAGAFTLAGCTTAVTTGVTVTSPTTSTITATVALDGEVADTVLSSPATAARLEHIISSRTGSIPSRSAGAHHVAYSTTISYPKLTAASGLLGVKDGALAPAGPDATTFTARLVDPAELRSALDNAVAGQPDRDALAAAVTGQTTVTVTVTFPGGVTSAHGPGPVAVRGSTATLSQPLSTFKAGTLTVTGDPAAPLVTRGRLLGALGLAGVGAGVAAWVRRRRRP